MESFNVKEGDDVYRTNYCEIDLDAIRNNVRVMKKYARSPHFLAVVKANAYGHGAVPVAKAALEAGADWLAVAIPEEGVQLRDAGIQAPILVLGGAEPQAVDAIAAAELTQVVFDECMIRALANAGVRTGKEVQVHLGIDTGMCRIGVRSPEEAAKLTEEIDRLPGIRLTGCFTHMATADEPEPEGTKAQIARFKSVCEAIDRVHSAPIIHHAANTASIFRYPEVHLDMVRGGIALYGYPPVPGVEGLRAAMRWITRAVYVKTIQPGEKVSYGGLFTAQRPTRVMTIPVGYADGYNRRLSCTGSVLVRGKRAPILGRVCMDQVMVDVTDIPGAEAGDEVVLIGAQGNECISAEEIASLLGTISYEVICSPSARVPRVYKNELMRP